MDFNEKKKYLRKIFLRGTVQPDQIGLFTAIVFLYLFSLPIFTF
jgi:hypothetical protein